jgi:hypothetical protein
LSLTQRLTLELLAEGPLSGAEIFRCLSNEREPLVHLGDTMFWFVLEDMHKAALAPFAVEDATAPVREWRMSFTDVGNRVLSGQLDWLDCAPPDRWVGGVVIRPGAQQWRWDPAAQSPVHRQ